MKHYKSFGYLEEGDGIKGFIGFLAVCLTFVVAYAWLIGAF